MRRTILLLPAVALAAASALAATSSNIVGYVKLSLRQGFTLVANQLDNGNGNKVVDLFTGVPDQFSVSKYQGGIFVNVSFVDGAWEGDDVDMTLAPGEGVFTSSPSASSVTFVGEVKTGASTVNIGANGFSIISATVPQQLKLDAASEFPIAEGDTVSRYINGIFQNDSFIDGAWEGDSGGEAPTVNVGEAFFVKNAGAAKVWTRTFTVN